MSDEEERSERLDRQRRSWLRGVYRRRVRQGAQLLDRLRPGWPGEVTPDELDMGDGDRCMIGQTFGRHGGIPYHEALDALTARARKQGVRLRLAWLGRFNDTTYGFQVRAEEADDPDDEGLAYEVMGELWLRERDKRLAQEREARALGMREV